MPTVLIIDDEPNIRRMVGALFGAEGYDVRDASDGASGLLRAGESEPDVVLLDLMMPGELDGMATLERLRAAIPDSPVVMMSGRAGLSDAVRATKLGAFTFLEKPLTPEGVMFALSSAMEHYAFTTDPAATDPAASDPAALRETVREALLIAAGGLA